MRYWQAEFDKHQRAVANKPTAQGYKTLRGFTIAQLIKQINKQ